MAESSATQAVSAPPVMPNTIAEGIGVVVRVRPLSTKERADPSVHSCIQALPDIVVIDANAHKRPICVDGKATDYTSKPPGATPASQPTRSTTRPYQFSVDHVFHTHASQIEVYEESCKRIVEGVFHGINGSILAYGATGSGKTHTMFGSTMSAAGIVYQAVQDIFAEKERLEEEEGKRVRIKCSFLEVYNEDVFDLLVKADSESGAAERSSKSANHTNLSRTNRSGAVSSTSSGARPGKRTPLQVRETGTGDGDTRGSGGATSGGGGLQIPGLTHIFPETLDDFSRGIEHGHAQRFVAATGANAQSSRSHAIITVEVEVRDDPARATASGGSANTSEMRDDDTGSDAQTLSNNTSAHPYDGTSCSTAAAANAVRDNSGRAAKRLKQLASTVTIASIQFGDLAGSERAAATSNTGLRLREGGNINRSLLALGAVVQSLAQQKVKRRQTDGREGGKIFVPYRGSKLTRLLRDSLGGNCRTMMLFCVSPSTRQVEETVHTMKFAMNAREIQVLAHRNEFAVNSSQLAKTQETLIEELRAELARTRADLAHYTHEQSLQNEVREIDNEILAIAKQDSATSTFGRQLSAMSLESPVVANTNHNITNNNESNEQNATQFSSIAMPFTATMALAVPPPRPTTPVPSAPSQRGTLTPLTSTGGCPTRTVVSPLSASAVEVSASGSMPRPSLSSRTARPSVFADNTRLFSELEAKLKEFSAQKEGLYHEVRDAEERQRDGEAQLRDLQWRLATFLVSDTYGSRARGEATDLGPVSSTIGVAGLRKTIASLEAAQVQQSTQLTELTNRLEEADRQFAATRTALLRERQGASLELLLDNARLRQGCTEAECLAAHYHQECRSLLSGESEYAEALSKCVGALQRLRPVLTQLRHGSHGEASSAAVAATEIVDVALLFAILPTASTAQRMEAFEAALRTATNSTAATLEATVQARDDPSSSTSPSPAFAHPPLAPSPSNRSGSGSSSPTRGGGSGSTPQSNQLAEQFRDLVATAESMHLTSGGSSSEGFAGSGSSSGGGGHGACGRLRPRHGHDPVLTTSLTPSRAFGRTVSLTGLTTTTTTTIRESAASNGAIANANKKRKAPLSSEETSRVRHYNRSSGGGCVAGRAALTPPPFQRNAGGTAGTKRAAPQSLQRSVSAPLAFSRTASIRVTSSSGSGGGRGDNGNGKKPKAPSSAAPVMPERSPGKASKPKSTLRNAHLSPKAMWSVSGTNATFTRSNTVKAFDTPSKQPSGHNAGGHATTAAATPPAKLAPRVSLEDTPHSTSRSSPGSSHRPPPPSKGKETRSLTRKGPGTAATVSAGVRGGRAATLRTNVPQRGRGRRGFAVGAPETPAVARQLMRSQTSTAALSQSAAATNLFQRRSSTLENTGTTISPLLSPRTSAASSLGGEDVDAAAATDRRRGLRAHSIDGAAGTCHPPNGANVKEISKKETLRGHDGGDTTLTLSRLLERSATAPPLPQYGLRSPLYPDDGEAYANKENLLRLAHPSRPRNSLPDDLTVSRSTAFSDSPLNSRELAGSGTY